MVRQERGSLGSGGLAVGISHSLPSGPHLIQGTHPLPCVQPIVHQGQGLEGGGSLFVGEGSDRAGSPPVSGLLQPAVCGDEGLAVVEAGHRPLVTESDGSQDIFQDGDSPIGSPFGLLWRLDGVSRLEGCVFAGSDASGVSQVPQICSLREGVPVQGSLFWPVHGSPGFHTGYGSCFGFSSPFRHLTSSVSRRLADPSFFPRADSPCSGYCAPALSLARNCRQLGEVSADSISAHGVSGSPPGFCLFQGFACPKESREASLNWRRILVLRRSASVILARAIRGSVFNDLARSGGKASDAVSSILPSSILGSGRLVCSGPLDSRDPSRPGVVARSSSLGARCSARSGIPSARLVVRRLGRGLGGSPRGRGNFRPLVSRGVSSISQRQKALSGRTSSSLLCSTNLELYGSCIRGQFDSNRISSQPRGHSIAAAQLHFAVDPSVSGVSSGCSGSAVYYGSPQCLGGFLSRPNQILWSEWTLKAEVFQDLRKRWPVSINLFATSLNHQCCPHFSPFHDPNALGTDALLQSWNGWQAYAFPPWSLIPAVLKKLQSSSGVRLPIIAP